MARFQRTRNVIRNNFNLRKWSDIDRIKADSRGLGYYISSLFRVREKSHTESFEQAVARMNLTEETLVERTRGLFRLACIMLGISGALLIYCLYSLINESSVAAIMSFMLTLVALTLAFRYHFWYFQLFNRRLGCTVKEWLNFLLTGKPQ